VALDNNKIYELSPSFILEITYKVKISLAGNPIKNRDGYTKYFIQDILNLGEDSEEEIKQREERRLKSLKLSTTNLYVHEEENPDQNNKGITEKEKIMNEYIFKNPQHFIEKKIAENVKTKLLKNMRYVMNSGDDKTVRDYFKLIRHLKFINRLILLCVSELKNSRVVSENFSQISFSNRFAILFQVFTCSSFKEFSSKL
jgi:hypothetical protein